MRLFNKLFILIVALTFFNVLTGIILAESNGIVFNWHPFIVNDYLKLNHSQKNFLPETLFSSEEIRGQFESTEELLHNDLDLNMIDNAQKVATKKSLLSKIKITVSPVNSFMMPSDENYSRGKDGNLSRASSILPSLLRKSSQEMMLETLKLIEPQINFGLEF